MIEDVTTALQAFATTGNGLTVTLPKPRFLTFKVQGNGNVTAGAVILECCPQNTPIVPGSGSAGAMVWTALTTIAVPANATAEYRAVQTIIGLLFCALLGITLKVQGVMALLWLPLGNWPVHVGGRIVANRH